MANAINMYVLIPRTLWETNLPVHSSDYHINTGTDNEPVIVSYTPTFHELADSGEAGNPLFSNNWDDDNATDAQKFVILKGEWNFVALDENAAVIPNTDGDLAKLYQAGVIPLTYTQVLKVIEKWQVFSEA